MLLKLQALKKFTFEKIYFIPFEFFGKNHIKKFSNLFLCASHNLKNIF